MKSKATTQYSHNHIISSASPLLREKIKMFVKKNLFLQRKTIACLFTSLALLIVSNNLQAESIWKKRVTLNTNLFNDNRARGIGDIVTVQINESTEITGVEDSSAENKKSHSVNVDTTNFFYKAIRRHERLFTKFFSRYKS